MIKNSNQTRILVNQPVTVLILKVCLLPTALFLASLAFTAAPANEGRPNAKLIASPEPGWPQWRGPRRDGICDETGLLQKWPEGGPKLLWKVSGLGNGYSCPIIVSNKIFITGDVGDHLNLFALDMEGHTLWHSTNGQSWKGSYPGARACCAYRAGRLFLMNAHGRVACFDSATGRELWAVDLLDRFGGKVNTWAYSECLLVDGTNVIVTPGGTQALMAALDAKTGQTVWKSEPLRLGPSPNAAQQRVETPAGSIDSASYAPPILFQFGARRQIAGCSLRHLFGVDAETGQLLWTRPLRTKYSVIASSPVLVEDAIFATAPDTEDAKLYRMQSKGNTLEVVEQWTSSLDTCHGGIIYLPKQNALYGSWYRSRKGWACVDARTGQVRYETDALAKGSVLYADGRLYILSEEGEMALVEPTLTEFNFTGRFRLVPEKKTDVWAHPVILDRKLYLRYHETLFCYSIER